jgi:2-methylfumaryl-CoA isomerase
MYHILSGLRVIEGASFIAGPYCGLTLQQLGAEVIRFDMIGGGPDFHRWPRSPKGDSLYWEGLNKGKKSIAIDLSRPEGRELAVAIVTAPGENAGIFVTNYPVDGFLSHTRLAARRPDLITARIMGHASGAAAVDYTVNCAVGLPLMTGPLGSDAPVNHVLPAWDLMAGLTAANTVLAAERLRRTTGAGQEIRVPLSDIAAATLGHLGQIAEVIVSGADRPRAGNDLFGAFGRDFMTRDGRRLMIVAITARQWDNLVQALGLGEAINVIETELGLSFREDEGLRYQHRDRLFPLVETTIGRESFAEVTKRLDDASVCWGPYQTLKQAVDSDPIFSTVNPVFSEVSHTSGYRYPTPGFAATFSQLEREPALRAPRLGENTDEVLAAVLGLGDGDIARLHDKGLVSGN